jgi:hypothetical protein
MFPKIRRRLTYANVLVTLVLVFAMTGGAYAAKKYLITSTKQISPTVLRKLQGKSGPAGKDGAPGAAGPLGPQGAQGPQGAKGETGAEGKEGPAGKSGEKGEEGSPWTAGGTLPSGKTLKGEWNVTGYASAGNANLASSVSYALPLVSGPVVHYIHPGEGEGEPNEAPAIQEEKCKGTVAEPQATPGNLCVFAETEENSKSGAGFGGVRPPLICNWEAGEAGCAISVTGSEGSRFGFGVEALAENAGTVNVTGTWAVAA